MHLNVDISVNLWYLNMVIYEMKHVRTNVCHRLLGTFYLI